ncbi:MAG TPA: DUF262 domain-containing protein [Acidimicrobiales bacterium]|nr:DUF262 domain-containing protein [Acidimicrobiales bacterium]
MQVNPGTDKLAIRDILDAWVDGNLSRNPEYQRGDAWSVSQQKLLIDSILRGYPLPRFYFHRLTGLKGLLGASPVERFEIIDGQQRIIAMYEFRNNNWSLFDMENEKVPLPKSIRDLPCPWSGRNFNQLDPAQQEQFLNTDVPVVVIDGVSTADEIRDLFIRLQAGTALTRQQVRDAWPGHVGPYVISLAGKLKTQPKFKTFSAVDQRGSYHEDTEGLQDLYLDDRQTCAQLLCLLIGREKNGDIASVTTQALDELYHTNIEFDPKGPTAQRFERVLKWCDQVLEDRPRTAAGRPTKVRKNLLFSLFLLFEDLDASRQASVDQQLLTRITEATWTPLGEAEEEPGGRVSSAATIAKHYSWFVGRKLRDVVIKGLDSQRTFNHEQKAAIWKQAAGKCGICRLDIKPEGSEEYDHIVPWVRGGPTSIDNGRPVHSSCHQRGRNVGLVPVAGVVGKSGH